jgi:ribosomal-protein-serine acetyltransferase
METDVILTGGNITLRPYKTSDIDSLYEAVRESVAELSVWMPWCHSEYSIDESRAWVEKRPAQWEQGSEYDFGIIDSATGLYLGGCGLNRFQTDWKIANLGYWVRTSQTKKGIATTAARLLVRFAFDELKLNRVEIIIATGNAASLRVAEKVCAVKEGILRNGLTLNDRPNDAVLFSLIPQDMI